MIFAIVLGALAVISLGYLLFGSSSGSSNTARTRSTTARPTPPDLSGPTRPDVVRRETETQVLMQPLSINWTPQAVPEAKRNIFAYYTPLPKPSPGVQPTAPLPTPTPPSLILASVSPLNVYARTGDFTLQISGDKFTPATRIYLNGGELPTSFVNAQQLSANVPAAMISTEGPRQVMVRTPDGKLFSNTATLNVQAPPAPNYTYVGIIGRLRHNDTAVLQDKNGRELLNVVRGDIIGGRFRVTSISEREVVLNDTNLRIRHTLPFTGDGSSTGERRTSNPPRYQPPLPPQKDSDDDDDGTP